MSRAEPTPLRVLFVQDHLARPGEGTHGVTSYLFATLPALDPAKVQARLCVLQDPRGLAVEEQAVRPRFLGRGKWDARAAPALAQEIREFDPDVLHLSAFKSMVLGRLLGRGARRRGVVVHLHDANPIPFWLKPVQRRLAPRADAVLAVSDAIGRFGVSDYGFSPEQVRVLHNGIPIERFRADRTRRGVAMRSELDLPADAKVIALVGRMAEGKGQEHVLRALPAVLENVSQSRLLLVGDGPTMPAMERLARDLGVGARARFVGFRSDVPDLLCASDLAVVPSLVPEGLGYTAIEALSAGVPVVAFASGGLAEVVEEGRNGRLVRTGDTAALAAAIGDVLRDDAQRARLAAGAAESARRFSVEHHARELEALYARVARVH